MSKAAASRPYALASGTLWTVLAEGLILPTGLISAAVLSRALTPQLYGLLAVIGAIIAWSEWSIVGFFSRATAKLIAEEPDWQPVAARILQLCLIASGIAALLLMAISPLAARLFDAPELTVYLRLYALEVPLVVLSKTLRMILVGLGRFKASAAASALRWTARVVLIIAFILAGWSLRGAILANIAAAALEVALLLVLLRPRLLMRSSFAVGAFFAYGVPLSVHALCLQLYQKVDLMLLQAITGESVQTGYYAAAQNLTMIPSIVALSFVPLLISTLTRHISSDQPDATRALSTRALRFALWLLPLGALVSSSADEIIALIFGVAYLPGAPLLSLLMLAGFVSLIFTVLTGILTALGRLRMTAFLALGLLLSAVTGHVLAIPRLGAAGAAWVTLISVFMAVIAGGFGLMRIGRLPLPFDTLLRVLLVCVGVAVVARIWPAPGGWVLLKLAVLALLAAAGLAGLGEFTGAERARAAKFFGLVEKQGQHER